jgi:hypothetical protein
MLKQKLSMLAAIAVASTPLVFANSAVAAGEPKPN